VIRGSVDIHVNSGPCFLPRVGNAYDMATVALAAGVYGWVFLSHHESTVGRAAVVQAALPELRCAGGVVLNDYVGGINPAAVRGAFLSGGRFVSFPTLHAENHTKVVGKGRAGVGPGDPSAGDGIRVIGARGELVPAARECIDIARQYQGFVHTGHVSNAEIEAIVDYCVAQKVPVVVTHPYFIVLGTEEFFAKMARKGAWIEVCGAVVMPVHPVATLDQMASLIRNCTPERCLLASDGGSVQLPIPHEIVRSFGWNLVKHGIAEEAVRLIAAENPRRLLNWN
jgi:hypothetical protein